MKVCLKNGYSYYNELRSNTREWSVPLSVDDVTPALSHLVEETYIRGVLAEELPCEIEQLDIDISPCWSTEPNVDHVKVTLTAGANGNRRVVTQNFDCGPWVRSAETTAQRLRSEGVLAEDEKVYRQLVAIKPQNGSASECVLPPLSPPPMVEQSLEQAGVRQLGEGSLEPDRPVLVNERLAEDAVTQCEAFGATETGGAVAGNIFRLREPLPGTRTRMVTVLSALLPDQRHTGNLTRFHISPEALLEGARIAALRGRDESVITICHTHGWGCGDCNQKLCALAQCYPSLQDYELEALFPTKALLLPIVGRKQGAPGRRPILQIHAFCGGELKPIRWQTYRD
jgi:hypothetical protein